MAVRTTKIKGLGAATFVRWGVAPPIAGDAVGVDAVPAAGAVRSFEAARETPPAAPTAGLAAAPHGQVAVFFREPKSGAQSIVTTIEWVCRGQIMLVRNALIAEIPATAPGALPRALCVMFRAPMVPGPGLVAMVEIDRDSLGHTQQKISATHSGARFGRICRDPKRAARAAVCMDALMAHVETCISDPARRIDPHTVSTDVLRGICRTLKHLHGLGFASASEILVGGEMPSAANVLWELIAHGLWTGEARAPHA